MSPTEALKMIWPIIILQLAVQIYALVDLIKKNKTKNLNVVGWALIIIFGEIVGSILYLLIGRAED